MGSFLQEVVARTLCEERFGQADPKTLSRVVQEVSAFAGEMARQSGALLPEGLPDLGALTEAGSVMGSPHYMAPEQAAGDQDRTGPRTDVYALGAMLYELLAGRSPFAGSNVREVLEQVRGLHPLPLGPAVPAALEAICLRCLAKSPEGRYATAAHLAEHLGRFLGSVGGGGAGPSPAPAEEADVPPTPTTRLPSSGPAAASGRGKSWWQFWK